MTHRAFALAIPLALAVLAGPAAVAAGPEQAAGEPARAFIERSLVLAPERVGAFTLVQMRDFPGQPEAGVNVRYLHDDFPEAVIDLFVYPMGRVEREQVLAQEMQDTRDNIKASVEGGGHGIVEFDQQVAFDLRAVAPDGSAGAPGAPGPGLGLRQSVRYLREDGTVNSLAYLFQRGLFVAKGRVSAHGGQVPKETFDRLANHAMATLVPVIEVRSTGGCSARTIGIDATLEGEALQAQLMERLLENQRQAEQENCAPTLDETVPAGRRGQVLVFPPELWRNG